MPAVFVFGSNLAGRHGKGAALEAVRKYGAIYGQGVGRQGMSYAIPTKDRELRVLALAQIAKYVQDFVQYARDNPETQFFLTPIGTGLAGYDARQIAPLFVNPPPNIDIPLPFRGYITRTN